MRIRCERVVAVCVIAMISAGAVAVAGAAEPTDRPIFPSAPLALTQNDDEFTVSVPVSNPTNESFTIAPAVPDDGQDASACAVEVPSKSRVVEPSASIVLELTVAERDPGCEDPSKGKGHIIVLTATSDAPGAAAVPIVLELAEGSTPPAEVKATGITWPKDPVFLRRTTGGKLRGEFTVVNPTQEPIEVTPPTVDSDCEPAVPSDADPETVAPGATAEIAFTVPACNEFDSSTMTVTVSAETEGGAKADVAALVLKAEVDWGRLGWWLVGILGAALVVAAIGAGVAIGKRNNRRGANPKVGFRSPLIVEADAPKSWLTAIAAVGPLLGALASTTDVTEGLTGSDSIPQSTLIAGVSALALVMVGVAGLIGNAPLARETVGKEKQDCPVVWQFALAAAVMATSAGITIWAFATAISRLDLALSANAAYVIAGFASVALGLYLLFSVFHYVKVYAGPLPAESTVPTPSAELIAAATQALAPYYLGTGPVDPCGGPPDCGGEPSDSAFDRKVGQWIDAALLAATRAAERAAKKAEEAKGAVAEAQKAVASADEASKERAQADERAARVDAGEAAAAAAAASSTSVTQVGRSYLQNLI